MTKKEYTKKEYIAEVLAIYDDFQPKDYRKNAERELRLIGIDIPNIRKIVESYPDFNSINLNAGGKGISVQVYVDPSLFTRDDMIFIASKFYEAVNGGKGK